MAREMKDSGIEWIGKIPASWAVNTIFQLFRQVKNKNEGLIETNLLSLSYGKIKRKNIDTIGGLLPESFDGYNIIEKNDIVIRLTDLQNDQKSLRVGLSTERGIVTSAYVTIRNISDNRADYLYYYLHTFDVAKGFYGMGAGVRQGLNWDGLKHLQITIPPLNEQHRIADFLDRKCAEIDRVLEKTRASIEEYKKLKQSVITQAVTKGIRGEREMKDSGIEWIGEIPREWEVCKLKHCCNSRNTKYDDQKGYLTYIALENIVSWTARYIQTESQYDISQSILCNKGDILFGKLRPYLAKVFLVDKDACCSGEFAVFCDFQGNASFYKYIFLSHGFINTVDASTYGTKMPRANVDFIRNLTIPIPNLSEQTEIANFLDQKCAEIDTLISKKEQLITELEAYKKSLIYEYVTGKKEVQ